MSRLYGHYTWWLPVGLVLFFYIGCSKEVTDQPTTNSEQLEIGPIVEISAEGALSAVLTSDGTVWVWGLTPFVEFPTTDKSAPSRLPDLTNVIAISATSPGILAIKQDYTVWSWQVNESSDADPDSWQMEIVQVPELIDIRAISGGEQNLAVNAEGIVWAWGRNEFGQLGDGTTQDKDAPVQILGLESIIDVEISLTHSLAVDREGNVWSWGDNTFGQLGDGTLEARSSPVKVAGLSNIIAVAATSGLSIALREDGTVWSWGRNECGQLGRATNRSFDALPIQIVTLRNIVSITTGIDHSFAIDENARLWAWGNDLDGALGFELELEETDIDDACIAQMNPVEIEDLQGVEQVSSTFHTLVLLNDGSIWGWGSNSAGQLGLSTSVDHQYTPIMIVDP